MFRGILLFFLLTAGLICSAQKVPRNVGYSDLDTGVTFPPGLGSFHKTEVRISSNPVVGTRIHYAGNTGRCLATIFIYSLTENPVPVTPKEFEAHCRTIRTTILGQAKRTDEPAKPGSLQVTEVESLGKSSFNGKSTVIFREKFLTHSGEEETYYNELVMLRLGDRIVKLRISVPSALTEENRSTDEFIQAFCRLFFPEEDPVFKPYGDSAADAKPKK